MVNSISTITKNILFRWEKPEGRESNSGLTSLRGINKSSGGLLHINVWYVTENYDWLRSGWSSLLLLLSLSMCLSLLTYLNLTVFHYQTSSLLLVLIGVTSLYSQPLCTYIVAIYFSYIGIDMSPILFCCDNQFNLYLSVSWEIFTLSYHCIPRYLPFCVYWSS